MLSVVVVMVMVAAWVLLVVGFSHCTPTLLGVEDAFCGLRLSW